MHLVNQPSILRFPRQSINWSIVCLYSRFDLFSALCMVIACVSFPFGWNSDEFRKICGPESNRFEVGLCGLRWAYPLAIIGILLEIPFLFYWQKSVNLYAFRFSPTACIDGFILATLSFILATRHVRLQPEPQYQSSMYKGNFYFPLQQQPLLENWIPYTLFRCSSVLYLFLVFRASFYFYFKVKSTTPTLRMPLVSPVRASRWTCNRSCW